MFLKALRYIERPDSTASHFHKIEAGKRRHSTWNLNDRSHESAWLSLNLGSYWESCDDIPTFAIDDHTIFIEGRVVELHRDV